MLRRALPCLLLLLACSDSTTEPDAGIEAPDDDASTLPLDGSTKPDSPDGGSAPKDECNGRSDLCARRFDEVVFAATHNAHSAQEYGYGVINANQLSGLQKQLDDGIRGLLMDVYDENGESVLCHGSCALGSTLHRDALDILVRFLEQHPREVIAIIYEDHLAVERVAADIEAAGLDAYVHTHEQGTAWPTLAEMIENDERLVLTLENGAPPPSYLHHVWQEAWDTPYQFRAESDFVCDLNRGARENALFLVNHWLSGGVGTIFLPNEEGAKTVNTYDVLYGRTKGCWDETGDKPNFVAVDFYEHGDLFEVVAALNEL